MQLLAQLNEHEVRYLMLWDFTRKGESAQSVGNFGLWLAPSYDNKSRFLSLLANMGYAPDDIQYLRYADFFNPYAFTLELPSGLEVDIMTAPEDCTPEDFEEYYQQRATPIKWEDISFHVIDWTELSGNHEAFTGQIAAVSRTIKMPKE